MLSKRVRLPPKTPLLIPTAPTHRPTNHPRLTLTQSTPIATAATATASATTPSPDLTTLTQPPARIQRHLPTQPPSLKPPDLRKSQLLRQYTSLLRGNPLLLLIQHNNLKAVEWAGIRRELAAALRRADLQPDAVKLQIIQTGMFAAALRVVEFHDPESGSGGHALSREAWEATNLPVEQGTQKKKNHPLHRLLSGPIAVCAFPSLSPEHLAAALKILTPTPGRNSAFAAPRRREAPGLYEGPVQSGLQKLMMLGARVEGRAVDGEEVRFVGGLAKRGGLEGLRAEVVALLQGVGMGLVGGLEGVGVGVWGTLEGRRIVMEEEGEGKEG